MTADTPSPQIKISWIIGTMAALAIFAVIGAYSSSKAHFTSDYDQQRDIDRLETLTKLRKEAATTLTTADWVDQDKKIVRIPIQEAMTKEIDILKSNAAHMCVALPGAAPAAPAPAAAAPAQPAPTAPTR